MIILGHFEPRLDSPTRAIGKKDVSITHLVEGLTSDQPHVRITIPAASVLVTIDTSPTRVGTMSIYYEYDLEQDPMEDVLELHALMAGDFVPPLGRLLGHFWHGSNFIALYAVPVKP